MGRSTTPTNVLGGDHSSDHIATSILSPSVWKRRAPPSPHCRASEPFEDAPFIPSHDATICHQWTCSPRGMFQNAAWGELPNFPSPNFMEAWIIYKNRPCWWSKTSNISCLYSFHLSTYQKIQKGAIFFFVLLYSHSILLSWSSLLQCRVNDLCFPPSYFLYTFYNIFGPCLVWK